MVRIGAEFEAAPMRVSVIDDFLSPEALAQVRVRSCPVYICGPVVAARRAFAVTSRTGGRHAPTASPTKLVSKPTPTSKPAPKPAALVRPRVDHLGR